MTSQPIRIGFVGLSADGWASSGLAPPLLSAPLNTQYKLTAVSTTRAESAAATAAAYTEQAGGTAIKAYHGDTSAIASDPDVDLVAVAVRTPAHKAALVPALQRKKDVFVEWPLGKNLAEALELAAMAKEAGVRTMIGMQAWQSPIAAKVREWISSGKIGRVLAATYIASKPAEIPYFGPTHYERDEYAMDPENGATLLSIFGGHHLAALTRMFGPLSSVSATTGNWITTSQPVGADGKPTDGKPVPHTAPDHFSVTGSLAAHPGAVFTGVWRSGVPILGPKSGNRPSMLLLIDGTEGAIRVETTDLLACQLHLSAAAKVFLNGEEFVLPDEPPFVGNTGRNWAEFAKGAEGDYPRWDDAIVIHKHIDAIARAAQEGRRIEIEL